MKPFKDRVPSREAILSMEEARNFEHRGLIEETIGNCRKALCRATGHSEALVTESGSMALFLALSAVEDSILLPDQGIWRETIHQCETLSLHTSFLKTDRGLVDTESLNEALEKLGPGAFLITSFAGYIAEQDVAAISKVCREHEALLIEDASSSIGDKRLAKGRFSDIIAGSAGEPKLLNLPSGGFLTFDQKDIINKIRTNHTQSFDPAICAGITVELKSAQANINGLSEVSEKIKQELDTAVHKDKRGICVGLLHDEPKKTARNAKSLGFVTERGRSIFTRCPRVDRFLEKGLVVEMKKIDYHSLGKEDIGEIVRILG